MYQVVLLAREGYEIKNVENKSLAQVANVFDVWLKEDAFNGEILQIWENYNLLKELNVCKKSDWRVGECFPDLNDCLNKKDARKYLKKTMIS